MLQTDCMLQKIMLYKYDSVIRNTGNACSEGNVTLYYTFNCKELKTRLT